MASAQPRVRKSLPARLLDLVNPLRDPSFTVAIVLSVVYFISQPKQSLPAIAIFFVLAWIAVKSAVWFFVNTIFSMGFLARKAWWVMRHPRLAWRLLDALGTEEIIVGGLHPDMFMTEDGGMQEAQIGRMMPAMPCPAYNQAPAFDYTYDQQPARQNNAAQADYYAEIERNQQAMQVYEQLIFDWITFTEEKWRAVSDSQLGWKPLRGRWNGWDEIYSDSYAARTNDRMARAAAAAGEALRQRFENARSRGSAASSVACFLRDLDTLRQSLNILTTPDDGSRSFNGTGFGASPSASRTGKSPIIRNPGASRVVDAN
ncbi:MAG: hypothetical protein H0X24_14865 [Ktedonobacterales bacterium]|nr:hypothetical protein [Ktedonobacterales bacterium]